MSSNGEFLFISDHFEGKMGQQRKEKFMKELREEFGVYSSGTNLMIYPEDKTKYSELPVVHLAHDCPSFERLLSYNDKERAQIFIDQLQKIYKIALHNGIDTYYTSEYTHLYSFYEIIEAFKNGEMKEINDKLLGEWQEIVNAIEE